MSTRWRVPACAAIAGSVWGALPCLAAPTTLAWTDYGDGTIRETTVGGGGGGTTPVPTTLYGTNGLLASVTADPRNGQIYWVEDNPQVNGLSNGGTVRRMNGDGSDVTTLVTVTAASGAQTSLRGIALDTAHGKMYWTDAVDFGHTSTINRANLDGSGAQVLLTTPAATAPSQMALDVAGGKMYWTDYATRVVNRANLDGTGMQSILSNTAPFGIALDAAAGRLYVTERNGAIPGPYTYKIVTTNLDGTDVRDVITTGLNEPIDLAIDPGSGIGFVSDEGSGRVLEFNLDGTGSLTPVAGGQSYPFGVTLVPEPAAALALFPLVTLALRSRRRRRQSHWA